VPGRGPFSVSINLNNIHMQVLVRNKHVPITKTGHLQGHNRATSGKHAGFCMLTLRRLMSYIYIYIYGAPILDVSRSHTTTQHSR